MDHIMQNALITIGACKIHFKIPPKKRFLFQLKNYKTDQNIDEISSNSIENKQVARKFGPNSQKKTPINEINKYSRPIITPRAFSEDNSMYESKSLLSVNILPEITEKNKSSSHKKLCKHCLSTDSFQTLESKNNKSKFILKDDKLFTQKPENYIKLKRKPFLRQYSTQIKASIAKDLIYERETKKLNSLYSQLEAVTEENNQYKLQNKQKNIPNKNLDQIIKNNISDKKNHKIIREEFTTLINSTNQINVENQRHFFNAFIEIGNNGILVRELIKNRWWWHLCSKEPLKEIQTESQVLLKSTSNAMPSLDNNIKKINLYWSEWLNKNFAQNLEPYDFESDGFKTIYEEYSFHPPHEEQKYELVKKITDHRMFNQIKNNISLRNGNYFKSSSPKPLLSHSNSPNLSSKITFVNPDQSSPNKNSLTKIEVSHNLRIHNHVIGCLELHSKTLLFKNLSAYLIKKRMDPFQFIPLTFYVENQLSDSFQNFLENFDKEENKDSIWILKPGENSNRGFGITIHKQKVQIQEEIEKRLNQKGQNQSDAERQRNKNKSVIIQKYIKDCFLINNRKFDFRCYILITTVNGFLKGYWYGNGYIRTSSEEYNLDNIEDRMIHLTNDAVQCKNSSFGKFEDYNKMSFEGFRKYLERKGVEGNRFDDALKRMKNIAYYLIASVSPKIKRYQYTFQLFGLDFMLDKDLKPYLIEANSNPCLDTKGPVLTKLIRNLIDNVIMTAIDPLFPPPTNVQSRRKKEDLKKDYFQTNMFQLIFCDKKSSGNKLHNN